VRVEYCIRYISLPHCFYNVLYYYFVASSLSVCLYLLVESQRLTKREFGKGKTKMKKTITVKIVLNAFSDLRFRSEPSLLELLSALPLKTGCLKSPIFLFKNRLFTVSLDAHKQRLKLK